MSHFILSSSSDEDVQDQPQQLKRFCVTETESDTAPTPPAPASTPPPVDWIAMRKKRIVTDTDTDTDNDTTRSLPDADADADTHPDTDTGTKDLVVTRAFYDFVAQQVPAPQDRVPIDDPWKLTNFIGNVKIGTPVFIKTSSHNSRLAQFIARYTGYREGHIAYSSVSCTTGFTMAQLRGVDMVYTEEGETAYIGFRRVSPATLTQTKSKTCVINLILKDQELLRLVKSLVGSEKIHVESIDPKLYTSISRLVVDGGAFTYSSRKKLVAGPLFYKLCDTYIYLHQWARNIDWNVEHQKKKNPAKRRRTKK